MPVDVEAVKKNSATKRQSFEKYFSKRMQNVLFQPDF